MIKKVKKGGKGMGQIADDIYCKVEQLENKIDDLKEKIQEQVDIIKENYTLDCLECSNLVERALGKIEKLIS
jgi:formyltetrahydrofolate synthetase